jgi:predicted metal-dependent HD superfamily phosphohydrolase
LRVILTHVEELSDHAADPDAVRLAAWYHDAVYQGRPDDEELSARRAESDLASLGLPVALIAEVGRLVRLTATHRPAPGDRNGEVLCDADLASLGSEPERYRANTAAIRAENHHVADDAFRTRRARIVRELLAAPAVFHTPLARSRWESRARANLADELRDLCIDT